MAMRCLGIIRDRFCFGMTFAKILSTPQRDRLATRCHEFSVFLRFARKFPYEQKERQRERERERERESQGERRELRARDRIER